MTSTPLEASVHFSSKTMNWATPRKFFAYLDRIHHFTLDVCASSENAKCARYFNEADDGLAQDWSGVCWMNPPYGKAIYAWMKKAYDESRKPDCKVVCLVPARTDTKWWHDYAIKGEITFVRGRLAFGAGKISAPFPSAIVVFA